MLNDHFEKVASSQHTILQKAFVGQHSSEKWNQRKKIYRMVDLKWCKLLRDNHICL
mgnify:CR=1 FL=1